MNKIGILSMQRICNYGSFMQAYCLKKIVKDSLNEDVEFIDYRVEKPIAEIDNVDRYLYYSLSDKLHIKYTGLKFRILNKYKWLPKYLNIKQTNYSRPKNIIIGSDEVFNCTQSSTKVGYSKELFGYGFDDSNVISYAASFGFTTIDRLKKYKIKDEVGNLLKSFKAISVRDSNSREIVKELTGKEPSKNLDPVLLIDINKFASGKVKYDKYIVLYAYSGRINPSEAKDIRKYADSMGCKIVSLGSYQKCADANLIVDPFTVLNYFKNAECIITDTFHGTIFASKFHKKFITLVRETNRNKLGDLLKDIRMDSREVKNFKDIGKVMNQEIDYSEFEKVIEKEKNKTYKYLQENIII